MSLNLTNNKSTPIGFIFQEGTELVGCSFDATKAMPIAQLFPEPVAGPFLLEAEVICAGDPSKKRKLTMLCAVGKQVIHVIMKTLPIFCSLQPSWTLTKGTSLSFTEAGKGDVDHVFDLNADRIPKGNWFYFKFGLAGHDYCTCMWSDEDQMLYNIPFYNFHTSGESCVGATGAEGHGEDRPQPTPFSKMLMLINGYTTPHDTYGGGSHFQLRPGTKEASSFTRHEMVKAVKDDKVDLTLCYSEEPNIFPVQHKIGAWTMPECLATPKARKAVLGKLQPFA